VVDITSASSSGTSCCEQLSSKESIGGKRFMLNEGVSKANDEQLEA
jgi:hypothetical protein